MSIDVIAGMNASSDVFNLLEIIFGSFVSAGCLDVILLCVYVLTDTSTRTTKLSFGYKLSQAAGNSALLSSSRMKFVINLVSPDSLHPRI